MAGSPGDLENSASGVRSGPSPVGSLKQPLGGPSDASSRNNFGSSGPNEFKFMESISTQSGEDDVFSTSRANLEPGVQKPSALAQPGHPSRPGEFRLTGCRYLDPKDDIVSSQFNLNMNLLKNFHLSNLRLKPSSASTKTPFVARSQRHAYQQPRQILMKRPKDPVSGSVRPDFKDPATSLRVGNPSAAHNQLTFHADRPYHIAQESRDSTRNQAPEKEHQGFARLEDQRALASSVAAAEGSKPCFVNSLHGSNIPTDYSEQSKETNITLKDSRFTSRETKNYYRETPLSSRDVRHTPKSLKIQIQKSPKVTLRDSHHIPKDHHQESKPVPHHMGASNVVDKDEGKGRAHDSTIPFNPYTRSQSVMFWYRPFSTSKPTSLNMRHGLQVVESLSGNVQKSWHLEAIKGLDRQNYSLLKMTMLRLTNSRFNIHPNRILIRCRGSWDVIQEGSFGTVYLGYVEGCGSSAIKVPNSPVLSYDPVGVMKRFINEWDLLTRCSHRNIVKIYGGVILGVFDIWLCTELVNGIDLHTVKYGGTAPRQIPPYAALKMCRQLADALVYLHTPTSSKGVIIHRDIKPENIIVDPNWNIKLCDFGDASESSSGGVSHVSGATWLYAPPELLLHPGISADFLGQELPSSEDSTLLSEKWDIWSVGCVFQEMFGYTGPFHHLVSMDDPPNVVCDKMVRAALRGLVPNIPHPLAKTRMGALILQCLDPNPECRPSARDLRQTLQSHDILSP